MQLLAVPVSTAPTFRPGTPKLVFERQYIRSPGLISYDISPDGQRFLMIRDSSVGDETSTRPELTVVLNWLDELKRLVPSN
jgi:serine/threonine-protein kinase